MSYQLTTQTLLEDPSEIKGVTKQEIVYEGWLYDVTKFVDRHPGGVEIIKYFTQPGEDATIPIQQFHSRSIKKVESILKSFPRRCLDDRESTLSSATIKRNHAKTEDFKQLYLELKQEGLFEPNYPHIIYRFLEIFILGLVGFYLATTNSNIYIKLIGCLSIGLAQGRTGWVQHEGGHHSLTGIPTVDRNFQAIIYGLCMGMSASFWRGHHNRHHAMTSRLKLDVDLDTSPLIAYNTKVLDDPKHDQTFFIRNQKYLLALSSVIAIIYGQTLVTFQFAVRQGKILEIASICVYYYLVYQIGFWQWFVVSSFTGMYLFGNFSLSHTFLPVTSDTEHWIDQAFLHTVDVEQKPWCDWWMGYLNYQIEHHLFPTMPQYRHPLIVERVKALASKHGLPYQVYSYKDAVKEMYSNLVSVAQELREL